MNTIWQILSRLSFKVLVFLCFVICISCFCALPHDDDDDDDDNSVSLLFPSSSTSVYTLFLFSNSFSLLSFVFSSCLSPASKWPCKSSYGICGVLLTPQHEKNDICSHQTHSLGSKYTKNEFAAECWTHMHSWCI